MAPIVLLALWLYVEIARPTYPLKIPMICSLGLGAFWLALPNKRWDPVIRCALVFLAGAWINFPFSENTFSAFSNCLGLTTLIAFIAIPAANLLRTIRHMHLYVGSFVVASAWVGLWAIGHSGYGPAGAFGGQDENYVSAAMAAAIPFAYFGFSAKPPPALGLAFLAILLTNVLATVIGLSRGGFLGMGVAGLFCFLYSPRKLAATAAAFIGIIAIVIFAPDKYWNEIESIGDRKDATADHRIELWKIATRMYLDNPVLGVGPGNFRWRIGDYQSQEQIDHFGRSLAGSAIVHSTYFEVLSETGTVGLVSFLSMIGLTFRDLRRASKRCDRALASRRVPLPATVKRNLEWARAYALAFQGGLLGFLTSSAFVSTTYFSTIWMMCASSVAIRYIVAGELESAAETIPSSPLEPAVSPPRTPSAGSASDGRPRSPSGSGRLSDLLGDRGRR